MKTLSVALVAMFAFSLSFVNGNAAQAITFQISNQQAVPLGQVTISTHSGDFYLNVAGNETDTTQIADTAISITVDGQTIPEEQNAIIQLGTGKEAEVIWVAPNEIDVIDEQIPA